MMMSYNSLVSSLQAKSVLSNIHASLVQHDGWLTKDYCEFFNMALEDKENAEWLSFNGAKNELYAEYKDDDAKLYMLLSYGLYIIKDEKFLNVLNKFLQEFVFEEMKEIDWSKVSSKDFLDYWNKDKSRYYSSRLYKKLEDYKTDNAYAPFTESELKGSVVKFTSSIDSYIKESILSFIEFGKQNIILGEPGQEWECVKGRKFESIFLDCTRRMNSIMEDLNNAALHLSDEGVIFVKTKRVQHDFVKYVVDHTMLEACFLNIFYPTYILKKEGKVSEAYIEQHESCNNYVGKRTHQNSISLSVLKDLNYNLNAEAIECMLEHGEKGMSLCKFLTPYAFTEHNDKEGHVFCYKNFAKDYKSVAIQSTDLDVENVEKCRKITSPVLLMNTDKEDPKIVYVNASENLPAYVPYPYPIFSLNEDIVCPEYIHYLCQNGIWETAIKGCSAIASGYAYSYIISDNDLADVTWEETFLHECGIVPIPSLPVQKQKIEDARLLQKVIDDKNKAKEALFNQKEWLNEAHIRNTKHRLTNDLFPLATGLDLLKNYLSKSGGHIQKDDMISKVTGLTVSTLIENLLDSVKIIENTISDFTNMRKYTDKCNICISEFLKGYCKNLTQKYTTPFKIETRGLDICAKIEISRVALVDMLDNIVGNAVRHGFAKDNDNVISFETEITNNGMCRLSIANNGIPMSERAKSIYYERGAFAGSTGHSGIGGAIVKDVCDQFKGKTYISEKERFPVVIVTEFPVLNL